MLELPKNSYLKLFTLHQLALFSDWLAETSELYVDVYRQHSGGNSSAYFIRSMVQFKDLVAQETWPEINFTVFRHRQYPLRGIANQQLLDLALQQIADGRSYVMVSLLAYPSPIVFLGNGNSHVELREQFAEVTGKEIGIGLEPPYLHEHQWSQVQPDEVFVLRVSKNRNYYEVYAKQPEHYKWLEALWCE